jgi:hypothetical protein
MWPLLLSLAIPSTSLAFPAQAGQEAASVGQSVRQEPSDPDSALLNRGAKDEQAALERVRRAHLPWAWDGGSQCDERIGRMCWNHDPEDRDWIPAPDPEPLKERREGYLSLLAEIAGRIPGDLWVAEQRVRYLGEQGEWERAERVARDCIRSRGEDAPPAPGPDPARRAGRCHDLLGYVLHRMGRFPEAEVAFRQALARMDRERAESRLDPRTVAVREAASWLDPAGLSPDSLEARRRTFWLLADPLWMVPGNDRWTEHQARFAAAQIREDSRNPHSIPWGSDLTTVLVRYGESVGWERIRERMGAFGDVPVVGHGPNGGRHFLPSGTVLQEPVASLPEDWKLHPTAPRSIHVPLYAERMGALDVQVARFLRPGGALVVAGFGRPWEPPLPPPTGPGVPRDGSATAPPPPPPPSPDPGAVRPPEAALLAFDPHGGVVGESRLSGALHGGLTVDLPTGGFVLGVELLDPGARRAWRVRQGISVPDALPDLAALSDLLLLEPDHPEVDDPTEAVAAVLPAARVAQGGAVGVFWETYGAEAGEVVTFEATIRPGERGLLRRAGEWLRLLDPQPVTRVRWEEPAWEAPAPLVRTLRLDLQELPQGSYELRMRAVLRGRGPVESSRDLEIVAPDDSRLPGNAPR